MLPTCPRPPLPRARAQRPPLPPCLPAFAKSSARGACCRRPSDLVVYECDGFVDRKELPRRGRLSANDGAGGRRRADCATTTALPFVPRGAGTSLAGGCLPVGGGVMIVLTRMKQILEINLRDRYAVVEPGVVNIWLTQCLEGDRLSLRPRSVEPGGLHHRRQRGHQFRRPAHAEIRRDGQSHAGRRGGAGRRLDRRSSADRPKTRSGLDLVGALVGSEGTLAIVTKVWVRLTRNPQGVRTLLGIFESVDDATQRHQRNHRRRHHSGGAGNDGPGDPGGDRGGLSFRLSARCRGDSADRSRRAGSGPRRAARPDHRNSASQAGAREVRQAHDAQGAADAVEVPQAGLRRRRPA